MYDWANSVYSLVITTAIFPIYFNSVTTSLDGSYIVSFFGIQIVNSVLYSYSLSFSFLLEPNITTWLQLLSLLLSDIVIKSQLFLYDFFLYYNYDKFI